METKIWCPKCAGFQSVGNAACERCGASMQRGGKPKPMKKFFLWTCILFGSFLFLLAIVGAMLPPVPAGAKSVRESPKTRPIDPHQLAMWKVTISKENWYKEAFGTVMEADFTIANTGDVPVKDLVIECEGEAESGTSLGTVTQTAYQLFPAHSSRKIHRLNMGFINDQTAASGCKIINLTVAR